MPACKRIFRPLPPQIGADYPLVVGERGEDTLCDCWSLCAGAVAGRSSATRLAGALRNPRRAGGPREQANTGGDRERGGEFGNQLESVAFPMWLPDSCADADLTEGLFSSTDQRNTLVE
jgi:hypothetical protein